MGDLTTPLILDTNVVLRFLIGDDPAQKIRVDRLFSQSHTPLLFFDTIAAEAVWVMTSFYKVPKEVICEALLSFLESPMIISNKDLLRRSLAIWAAYPISYVDSYIVAQAQEGNKAVATFDKRLAKVAEITVREP